MSAPVLAGWVPLMIKVRVCEIVPHVNVDQFNGIVT